MGGLSSTLSGWFLICEIYFLKMRVWKIRFPLFRFSDVLFHRVTFLKGSGWFCKYLSISHNAATSQLSQTSYYSEGQTFFKELRYRQKYISMLIDLYGETSESFSLSQAFDAQLRRPRFSEDTGLLYSYTCIFKIAFTCNSVIILQSNLQTMHLLVWMWKFAQIPKNKIPNLRAKMRGGWSWKKRGRLKISTILTNQKEGFVQQRIWTKNSGGNKSSGKVPSHPQ